MKHRVNRLLLLGLIFPLVFSSSLVQKTAGHSEQSGFCDKFKPCQLLVQTEAEKILGQPVRLTQDVSELRGDVRQCTCGYMSVAKNKTSGQDIHLFFAIEQSEPNPSTEQARQVMESTKTANAQNQTILDLSGIGDEAFQLGDQPDRPFIMARKGAVILRLQIREALQPNSLEKLKAFARGVLKQF